MPKIERGHQFHNLAYKDVTDVTTDLLTDWSLVANILPNNIKPHRKIHNTINLTTVDTS